MVGVPNSIDPQPHQSTFWKALPGGKPLLYPMLVIATLAAIVASQALISAVCQQPQEHVCVAEIDWLYTNDA